MSENELNENKDVIYWLEEIKSSQKREKDWRKNGEEILSIYENEKNTPFNILYSNTETLLPALFSQMPRPVIERRFKDDDPVGRHASMAGQRMLEYLIDTDIDKYDNYEQSIIDATLDGLLPGRGITQVKYDAEVSEEGKSWETVCTDSKKWNRVYFGYATKWSKMPWVAYEEYLDKDEAKELFGETAEKLVFTEGEEGEEKTKTEDMGKQKTALVYQIWDKSSKTIKYVSPQYKEDFLKEEDDPLELSGFFNCPKPIQFVQKSNDLMPVSLYSLYENQAKELNKIQLRINKVVDAIKVRGVYDGMLGSEIEKILTETDNALVPTDKGASIAAEGGLDKAIWFLPIGELIGVLQQLYQARESCKRVIYEITGISDIVRGQSMASETLGAQKIKESWGTMRLKRLQKEVQRYALDLMKIELEVAIHKFSEETWAKVTMLPFPTEEQKQQALQMMNAAKQQGQQQQAIYQQQAQQAQAQGMQPPPPPPSPQIPPQVQQMATLPSWKEILDILKNDTMRSYRLDIETNSTLDVEATEDKQLVGEFMNAMAQFMNGIGPMIQSGTMPWEAAKSMMLAIVKRYRFGREVEEQIKNMQAPKPPQNPEMEQQAKQLQQEKQKMEQEKQQLQAKFKDEAQKIQTQKQDLNFQKQMADMELRHKEELSKARDEIRQTEMVADVESMFAKQKRDLQAMMDKQASRLEKLSANLSA